MDIMEELQDDDQASKYPWLRVKPTELDAAQERRTLAGSIQRDIALWFVLASIGAAWLPGPVTHRGVMHSYVIVLLWALLHHSCRRATIWNSRYVGLGSTHTHRHPRRSAQPSDNWLWFGGFLLTYWYRCFLPLSLCCGYLFPSFPSAISCPFSFLRPS